MRITALCLLVAVAASVLDCGVSARPQIDRSSPTVQPAAQLAARRVVMRDPSTFLDVEYTDTGSPRAIELRSATTGKVVKVLAAGPLDYQGGALAPNGRHVYIARSSGWIDQITVATGAQRHLTRGESPAISPNGRFLAYTANGMPTVRDLQSGAERRIDLGRLHSGPGDSITWLGDSATLVMAHQPTFFGGAGRPLGNCRNGQTSITCLLLVHLGAGPRLALQRVVIPGSPGVIVRVAGVNSRAEVLLLYRGFPASVGGYSLLTRAKITRAGMSVSATFSLGRDYLVTFGPSGRRIIYQTAQPRALWSATISPNRLTNERRLSGPEFWGAAGAW